eukprot:346281-Rhodomonas_salina.1
MERVGNKGANNPAKRLRDDVKVAIVELSSGPGTGTPKKGRLARKELEVELAQAAVKVKIEKNEEVLHASREDRKRIAL